MGEEVVDLAAAYARHLAVEEKLYEAQELADAIIPADMTAFLGRWPFARLAMRVTWGISKSWPCVSTSDRFRRP